MRDDFVVRVGIEGRHFGPEVVPEFDDDFSHRRVGFGQRRDEAGAASEQFCIGVLPAGFFRTGHRMRADEVRVLADRGVAEAGDFALHAADVRDDGARGQVRGDQARELDDFVHGRGDDDEVRPDRGGLRRVRHGVAPRLVTQSQPGLRAACPHDNALRKAACARSLGHGAAEQARCENGELGKHVFKMS